LREDTNSLIHTGGGEGGAKLIYARRYVDWCYVSWRLELKDLKSSDCLVWIFDDDAAAAAVINRSCYLQLILFPMDVEALTLLLL
jgi:hypothetical protein